MKKLHLHLLLVASMFCGIPGTETTVKAEDFMADGSHQEQQVSRHDPLSVLMAEEPEAPVGSILRNPSSSCRLAASRSLRLLPTHGGKPGSHNGRGCGRYSFNPLITFTRPQHGARRHCRDVASPRRYYVIALRRLLC